MPTSTWFDDLPVLGRMAPAQAAAKLHEIGENELAAALEAGAPEAAATYGPGKSWWPFPDKPRPWQHTAHAFGHLAMPARTARTARAGDKLPIQNISSIRPDPKLVGQRIKVVLNRLRVADYPGSGMHHVLFDFYAQHQAPGTVENLHFNATYRVRQGEQAAIIGYPIFVGLTVGGGGLAFKCFTVNVQNDDDEKFLGFLESDVFRSGLKLATTAQPAIGPLSELAVGLTRSIASRNKNVPVQDFYLGLDIEGTMMGARLALGDYIAVQIPETMQKVWSWQDWVYDPAGGEIVAKADETQLIPYNYIVFGVSRYTGD